MIKEIAKPKLKNPIFIAAWPGMGEVAYRSAMFLKEVLGFKLMAKLEAYKFFKQAAVSVEKGIINNPSIPSGIFYYYKSKGPRDLVLFVGEAQPPLEYAQALSLSIINYIKKYKIKLLCTFAAKPEPIDHKAEAKVWVAATHKETLKDLEKYKLTNLEEGQISGLNGIILGVAKKKSIKGFCLLAEIPFYTVQIENPKATGNILRIMDKFLKLSLNFSSIEERTTFIEAEIDKLISYLKGEASPQGPLPLNEEDIDKIKKDLAAYTKLPQSAREKIENLFKESDKNIASANELKTELDSWNVYNEYEDRFLDLFKKKGKKEGQ